jgi:hypothetical protein
MRQDVYEKLSRDFKVDQETCSAYEKLYAELIEPTIRLKYLSHLISTLEDMINDKFKKKYIFPILDSNEYTEEEKRNFIRSNFRPFSILLRPIEGLNGKAYVTHCNFGSIIVYDPRFVSKDIRILVAHELGHIVNNYLLLCEDTQNRANVFGFTVINGKNEYYKNDSKQFTYNSELEIIDAVFSLCPITEYKQIR